ncbi:MAG: NAD-dependent epimerase/dehydratase family protein [bacterium]
MKKTVITGAGGFVGRYVIGEFRARGYRVVAADIDGNPPEGLPGDVDYRRCDVTQPDSLKGLFDGADVVVHMAAVVSLTAPPPLMLKVNRDGVENACREAMRAGAGRFLHFSSASVYGVGSKASSETSPKRPGNLYESTKQMGEEVARRRHSEHGLPVTIIQPAEIYGPGRTYGEAMGLIMMARAGWSLYPGRADNLIGHVHVEDAARAARFLAELPEAEGETYIVSDNTPIASGEMIRHAARLMGIPRWRGPWLHVSPNVIKAAAEIADFASKLTKTPPLFEKGALRYMFDDFHFDNSKLLATGFELKYPDYREGVKETIQWIKDNAKKISHIGPKKTAGKV